MTRMPDLDTIAANLHAMVDGAPAPEFRSIENAALPVSPAQLEGIWGYGPTRSGVQINEFTAITYSAVFAAVRVLSESIGMLPLAVFRGDEDEDVKVRARDHTAYQILRWQPNPEMSASVFKEALQANLTLWGNGYARIEFNNAGEPAAIYPLESARTYVTRFAGELRYVTERYGGGNDRFAPEEILHVPGLTLNGVQGLSPVAYAREAIAMGKAAEIFGAEFFGNGAQLGGVLTTPNTLKPEAVAQMRESWNAMHAGVGNAHKTAFLQGGTTFTRIGIPPDEAQFLETRKFQIVDVARIYRIPPHMLGDLERSTHSNIEQASLEFLVYTLTPWLEKWEQELTRKLCGSEGQFHVKFDDRRLLRTDIAARQAFYQIGRQWGFLNSDEIRAQEGMSPLANGQGQIYFAPVNMVPLDKFGQHLPSEPPPGDPSLSPPPGASPPGASPPAKKPPQNPPPVGRREQDAELHARAIAATHGVFEDAIGRMLRKEANAAARGKADDDFYRQHSQHVRDALYPAARTLLAIAGQELDARSGKTLLASIDALANARHALQPPATLAANAARLASELPAAILRQLASDH